MIWQSFQNSVYYRLFLCNPIKEIQCEINYTALNFTSRFNNDANELNFETSYVLDLSGEKDDRFDLIQPLNLVLMQIYDSTNTLLYDEYFTISNSKADRSDDGRITKQVDCVSEHYLFLDQQFIPLYKQTAKLYDESGSNGIINYMLSQIYNIYTVSYISPSLVDKYRVFEYTAQSQWEILLDLGKQFNCCFVFDNVVGTIQIMSLDDIGDNSGLLLNNRNFIKSISSEDKLKKTVTRIYAYGKSEDINIRGENITGQTYIDNFDDIISKGLMPTNLATKWNSYKALIDSKNGLWVTYNSQLDGYQASLLTKQNELDVLNQQKVVLETNIATLKKQLSRNNATANSYYSQLQTKLGEISTKEAEITVVQGNITTVNNNITALQTEISWDTYFTLSERQQLIKFVRYEKLSFDSIGEEQTSQLYEYALAYLNLKSQVPVDIRISLVDILSCEDLKYFHNKVFKLGDYATVDVPELGYNNTSVRIIEISHNPIENSLEFTCSNQNELQTDIYNLDYIFAFSKQSANLLTAEKSTYSEYSGDKSTILYTGEPIDTNETEILAGDNIINQRGFLGRNLVTNGTLEYLADKIVISPDNGANWRTLLSGSGLYMENANSTGRVVITPDYGFQIDKWNNTSSKFDNVFYLDTNGNTVYDGGYIKMLSANNKNQILLNPTVGIKIQKTNGFGGWVDKFWADSNGDLQLTGTITMNGGSIVWDNVNKPTVSQIGALANDQTSVFNALTDNGNLKGLFMSSGNLYMNADYIKAGTIQIGSIPTLDNSKIQSASAWDAKETPEGAQTKANAAETSAKGYTDTKDMTIRSDLRLSAPLPTSLTLNSSGIKASTSDPTKYAILDYRGLYINNGALQINNTSGQTLIDGSGVYSNYIIGDFISTSGWTGTGINHIKIQKNLMYFKEDDATTKMAIGFLPNKDNTQIPLIVLGAGDGYGNNRGYIQKDTDGMSMYYVGDLSLGEVSYLKLTKDNAILNGYEVFSTKSSISDSYIASATNWNTKLNESEIKAVIENPTKNWNIPAENLNDAVATKITDAYSLATNGVQQNTYYNNVKISQSNGLQVLDNGNIERVKLGSLDNGAYGLQLKNNSGATTLWQDSNGNVYLTGNIVMTGGSISWANINKPTASQIGALPDTTYIPTLPSYITQTKITQTSIESPEITGGTLTGAVIQTGLSGERLVLSGTGINTYSSGTTKNGWQWNTGGFLGLLSGYSNGVQYGGLQVSSSDVGLHSYNNANLFLSANGTGKVKLEGTVDFTNATVSGLSVCWG